MYIYICGDIIPKHTSYLVFRAVEEDVFEDQLRNRLPIPKQLELVNYLFFLDI